MIEKLSTGWGGGAAGRIWYLVLLWMLMSEAVGASGPFDVEGPFVLRNRIDALVSSNWAALKVCPAARCSDAVFFRRAHFDLIGTLPGKAETREFLESGDPGKRAALVERLLAREEFADYWAMKWSDLLRVKAEFPINLWPNAAQAYHQWIHTAIRENRPYDQFARELLESSGSNFRIPQVNFYRAMQNRQPEGIARTVALTFMGTRAEKWPDERLSEMAAFFAEIGYKPTLEWKEEIVFFDGAGTNSARRADGSMQVRFPDGTMALVKPGQDPRAVFAEWLTRGKNPWFARSMANRVWAWLLGRGIVHEPDDFRPDNPPSNPELLAYLESELIASRYDLKHLFRLILNSSTYQLSSIPGSDPAAPSETFASYPVRRLEAEVLVDALNRITGSAEKYSSAIPEPFTFVPEDRRSITLPDGSISSPFLESFGRPARDTGLESERNNAITAAQRLHWLNSTHVQRKIEQSRLVQFQSQGKRSAAEIAEDVYLTVLSRPPTDAERKTVEAHLRSAQGRRREAVIDLVWALLNTPEFLCRH